jgi:hypothetical protein
MLRLFFNQLLLADVKIPDAFLWFVTFSGWLQLQTLISELIFGLFYML